MFCRGKPAGLREVLTAHARAPAHPLAMSRPNSGLLFMIAAIMRNISYPNMAPAPSCTLSPP
jgi:hypothetical protein